MIYVHVPFCRSFCTYCGFYSEICSRSASQQVQMRVYTDALLQEIESRFLEIGEERCEGLCPDAESLPACGWAPPAHKAAGGYGIRTESLPAPSRSTASESEHIPVAPQSDRRRAGRSTKCDVGSSGAAGDSRGWNPLTIAGGYGIRTESLPAPSHSTASESEHFPVAPQSASPLTLYIGGGTPSILPVDELERIVTALGAADYQEFTIEVNPDDIIANGPGYLQRLTALGVNRISMGVQSFDDGILKWMNRRHDADGARRAFSMIREAGVENISIDLIFGLSQLTEAQWRETVREAIALHPEHISAYQLSIDENSALAAMVSDGRYVEAPEEQCRAQYDLLCSMLAEAGYEHYEISNWAKPGFRAVHNSAYWRRVPYLGFGPGAHSLPPAEDGKEMDRRCWNSQELATMDEDGTMHAWHQECETLSREEIDEERVMLALRTADGMREDELKTICGNEAVERLLGEGALTRSEGSIRIPEDHFFVSDDIIAELISCIS